MKNQFSSDYYREKSLRPNMERWNSYYNVVAELMDLDIATDHGNGDIWEWVSTYADKSPTPSSGTIIKK